MTRALNQVRRWQEDPEAASALSFRIEDEWKGGKSHVRLRVVPTPDQDGAGWTKAQEYRAIARLPRDDGRGKHGGARIACPKHPDAPLTRTRIWRCTEDDCAWVHQDTATIGAYPDQDGAGAPRRLIPVSMVTREDMEWADSPHYWGEAPPEPPAWQPPPIAPRSHIARGFRRMPATGSLPAVAGGNE